MASLFPNQEQHPRYYAKSLLIQMKILLLNKIDSDRFQASGNGSLNIDKVEWNIGGLKIEATIPDATDPSEYDKRSLNIISFAEWSPMVVGLKMRKLKLPTKLMVQSNIM